MLTLDLPIAAEAAIDPRWQAAFAGARAAQPQPGAWTGTARERGDRIEVTLSGSGADLPAGTALDAFVVQRQVVGYAPPQISRGTNALTVSFAKSEYFTSAPAALDLLLVAGVSPNIRAWSAHAPLVAAKPQP